MRTKKYIIKISSGLFIASPKIDKVGSQIWPYLSFNWHTNKNYAYKFTQYEKDKFLHAIEDSGLNNIKIYKA